MNQTIQNQIVEIHTRILNILNSEKNSESENIIRDLHSTLRFLESRK